MEEKVEKKAESNVLSLAGESAKHRPTTESEPIGLIVRLPLALTVEGGNTPFVLAFCAAGGDECFLVKAGARFAVCHQCETRHEVMGLIEAIEEREIALGGDDGPWPVLMPEILIGKMFRAIQKESRPRAGGSAEGGGGKGPKGGVS